MAGTAVDDLMDWLNDDTGDAACPDVTAVESAAAAEAERARDKRRQTAEALQREREAERTTDSDAVRQEVLGKVHAVRDAQVKVVDETTTAGGDIDVAMNWTSSADLVTRGEAALQAGDASEALKHFTSAARAGGSGAEGAPSGGEDSDATIAAATVGMAAAELSVLSAKPAHATTDAEVSKCIESCLRVLAMVHGGKGRQLDRARAFAVGCDGLLLAAAKGYHQVPSSAEVHSSSSETDQQTKHSVHWLQTLCQVASSSADERLWQPAQDASDAVADVLAQLQSRVRDAGAVARHVTMKLQAAQSIAAAVRNRDGGVANRVDVQERPLVGRTLIATVDIPQGGIALLEEAVFAFPITVEAGLGTLAVRGSQESAGLSDGTARRLPLVEGLLRATASVGKMEESLRCPEGQQACSVERRDVAAALELLAVSGRDRAVSQRAAKMTADRMCHLVAMVDNNALCSAPELGVAAVGSLASMAEHSCQPNCHFCVLPGGPPPPRDGDDGGVKEVPEEVPGGANHTWWIALIAHRDIREGDRLSISYVDTAKTTPLRRRTLKERYDFDCGCALCAPGSFDPARAFECQHCGDGYALPHPRQPAESQEAEEEACKSGAMVEDEWVCCPTFTFGTASDVVPCGRPQSVDTCTTYAAIERHRAYSLETAAEDVDFDGMLHSYAAPGHFFIVRGALAQATRLAATRGSGSGGAAALRALSLALPLIALVSGRSIGAGGWSSTGTVDESRLTEAERDSLPQGRSAEEGREHLRLNDDNVEPVAAPPMWTDDSAAEAVRAERHRLLGFAQRRDASAAMAAMLLYIARARLQLGDKGLDEMTATVFDAGDLARRAGAAIDAALGIEPAAGSSSAGDDGVVARYALGGADVDAQLATPLGTELAARASRIERGIWSLMWHSSSSAS